MDWFIEFLETNFSNCVWLAVLIVAMLPTIESKIAIPLAMNSDIWGINALSPFSAFVIATIGSILPSLLIIFVIRKLKSKTAGFVTSKFLQKYKNKTNIVTNKNSHLKQYLTLATFVSVPIPLTGVWTGSLIAGLSNLNIKYCFFAISFGAIISSAIVTILCIKFSNSITTILIASILVIVIFLFGDLLYSYIKEILIKRKKKSI